MARDNNYDSQVDASRVHYVAMRNATGCPPILCDKTPWGYYVETKDGKIRIDQLNAANAWDAKTYCVEAWIKEKERLKEVKPNSSQD